MKIKKHSIGYNTVSSVDGIINARGVKSKPNDIQISGYTNEIGEGEKSPDNPYELISLDSGNLNLYSEDKITNIQVTNDGIIRKGFAIDASEFKSKYCSIYFDEENSSQISLVSQSRGINIKFLYKNGTYETFKAKNFIKSIRTDKITEDVEKVIIYNGGADAHAEYFSFYIDLMILDSPIVPNEYITDKHSIALSNNNTIIQVPVPIALKSVDGVSDRIIKKDNEYYIEQNIKTIVADDKASLAIREQKNNYTKFNINIANGRVISSNKIVCNKLIVKPTTKNDFDLEYIRSAISSYPNIIVAYMKTSRFATNSTATKDEILAYLKDNHIETQYQVENPYYLKLSDYAQDLLNSFTLQNNNKIWVEGYPDIKISGYIQK